MQPARRKQSRPLSAGLLVLLPVAMLWITVQRYSLSILVPASFKQLPAGAAVDILRHHRFVLLGGPHRGGTTILWRLLSAHPLISAFAETEDTDFGEGAFLQTVLPPAEMSALTRPDAVTWFTRVVR